MAANDRYWVPGGTGYWSSPTNWSLSSGGASGASAPISANGNFVYFDANSGTGSATLTSTVTIVGLNCTGFAGTLSILTATSLIVAGNTTLSAAATYSGAGTFTISIPDATTRTLTTNNANLQYTLVNFNGVTQATSILTLIGALNVSQTLRTTACTLNFNSYVVTCGLLKPTGNTTFAFGNSGTSAIVIPTGGIASNTSVVDFSVGSGYTSTYSGTQRPILRLTYAGAVGSRKVVDGYNLFDYVWSGADLNNSISLACQNLNLSNFTGSINMGSAVSISGNLTFNAATQWIASTLVLSFNGTGTQTIDTKGITLSCPVTFNGSGTYVISNDMLMGAGTNVITLTSGTLNLNGKTLTVSNFASNNTNVRGITFASGKIATAGTSSAWLATTGTNFTITGPGSIELTNTTAGTRIFDGGSIAYSGITLISSGPSGGGSITTIKGSNTFYSMRNSTSPQTIYFTPATTTIFTDNFELNGTAGKNITIGSSPAPSSQSNAPNFAKPSGSVVCSYANISQNNAGYTSGPAAGFTSVWNIGTGSTLASTTTGWGKAAATSSFLSIFYP